MKRTIYYGLVTTLALISACAGEDTKNESATDSSTSASSGASMTSTTVDSTSAGSDTVATSASTMATSVGTSTTTTTTSTESTGCSFLDCVDMPPDINECDIWAQDCMAGEKCMPWANDGGGAWNATKCSPVNRNPKNVGDACTVEGSGVSGIDDCDVSAMCWNVDPETSMGECVAFCTGSEASPACDDITKTCVIANGGVLILCLPTCDPLLQNCEVQGQVCYPINNGFACAPDVSGEMGVVGDPCEFINVCDPGKFCADAAAVPNCAAGGCCAEFCELDNPMCTLAGTECTAWYAEGEAPPGFENLGACVIPG